jgi:hypothetical protein
VENRVVVETAVDVMQEILGTDRRLFGVQLDFDLAEAGVQQDVRRLVGGHDAGGEGDRAGGEQEFFQHGSKILRGGSGCEELQQGLVEDSG